MKRVLYRSAITGEYVTEEHALANPDTTVTVVTQHIDDPISMDRAPIKKLVLWYPLGK